MGILQYPDLALEVDGVQYGLVQNVSFDCDSGLDSINYSSGIYSFVSDRAGTISYETIANGISSIQSIAGFDSPIDIKVYDKNTSSFICFKNCLINSTEYTLTNNTFFTVTTTYTHVGVDTTNSAGNSYLASSYPETGKLPFRQHYIESAPGFDHQSIIFSTNINRQNLYNKGFAKPYASVINYPIETSLTLTMAAHDTGVIAELNEGFLKDKLEYITDCYASYGLGSIQVKMSNPQNCAAEDTVSLFMYLQSISNEGGGVDGQPLLIKAEYISYNDFDTKKDKKRLIKYEDDTTSPPSGPPPEPE